MNFRMRLTTLIEYLPLLPVLGILFGLLILPFLDKGTCIASIISVYTVTSSIFIYVTELVDRTEEAKRCLNLPREVKKNLNLWKCLIPLDYILLSCIFLPIIAFAFFNYWTNHSLHWSIFASTILASIIFTYFDDIREENEEVCDGYDYWGDYL